MVDSSSGRSSGTDRVSRSAGAPGDPGATGDEHLWGEVLRLAWPVMLSMGLGTLFVLVDAFWIGRLGPGALAAVAPAQFASWVLWTLSSIIETGVPALVARAVGAGDKHRAEAAAAAGLQIAAGLGVVIAALAPAISGLVFRFVELSPEAGATGMAYLNILLWGSGGIFVFIAFEASARATGDTRTPMLLTIIMLGLNFALDPLLILGPGPFPRWGVPGAAIATVISQVVGAVVFIVVVARGRGRLRIRLADLRRRQGRMWARVLRTGLPGSLNAGLFTVVYVVLAAVVARFGAVPLAVLGVGNRLESINYLIASGFHVSASTLVGQSLGAGRPARAERAAWVSTLCSAAFTGLVGTAFFLFPGEIFALFVDDPETIAGGATFLRIIALCQLWMGVEIAVFGAFVGAGNTVPPVAISSVISLMRIPLAFWIATGLGGGVVAVWWVLSLTCVLRGGLLALWFRRGGWKGADPR